jgi:hypothetical protein
VKVTKQVLIVFASGKYSDEIMQLPWQFDRKAIHDGFRNRYPIVKDGKTITLVPLSLKKSVWWSNEIKKGMWGWEEWKFTWG